MPFSQKEARRRGGEEEGEGGRRSEQIASPLLNLCASESPFDPAWFAPITPSKPATMQTQHLPSGGLHAKENAVRNIIQPSGSSQASSSCRPSSAPSFGSADSPYIEHTRRDSRGVTTTRRYLKGQLLGKGGFAKCYKITDVETKKDWACKVVQKSSLTKQRHKVKVGIRLSFGRCH